MRVATAKQKQQHKVKISLPTSLTNSATLPRNGARKLVDGIGVGGYSLFTSPTTAPEKLVDGGEVNRFSWDASPVNRANKRFLITHKSRGSIVAFR